MSEIKSLPCTMFDHVLWLIEAGDGSPRRAEILLGECLLLFTSLDSVQDYLHGCEDLEEAGLRPVVFSRNRKEFGQRARRAVQSGIVGALFDPAPGHGEAPFLRFAKVTAQ
jgi:hypothetical protein